MNTCGRTSRKRPPKIQRLGGCLPDVVTCENRQTGSVFREGVPAHLIFGRL